MDPESDPSESSSSPIIRLSEEIRGVDGFLVSTRVPCEDPSTVPEAVPLTTPSDSLSEEDEGVVPGPFDVSLAHKPCSSSYLDRLLSDKVVTVSEEPEDEAPTTSGQEVPSLDPEGGPHTFFPEASFMTYMERNAKYIGTKFWIQDPYFVVRAKSAESVLTPPAGCVSVYHHSMQMGLRFPLHPFIKDLLNGYQLTLTNLLPNSWLTINGFVAVCDLLGVAPSLRLWRNVFTLMLGPAERHGPGWFRFQCRPGYKVVRDPPSNQKGFRRTFYHVYTSGDWGIPILPPEEGPRFRLNQTVPEMSREEAVAGIYLSTTPRIHSGDLAYVPSNWLPTRHDIRNEMFLAAVGLSCNCDKGKLLIQMCNLSCLC